MYHVAAYGAPPYAVRKWRASLSQAVGLGGPARCTTTAIAIACGFRADPALVSVMTVIEGWLTLWTSVINRPECIRAWSSAFE
eukprot:5416832-Alexandrium_andersonii.AAC.1